MEQATQQKRLNDMIEGFHSAMLVTLGSSGEVRGRPMAVAAVEGEADVYFATRIDSGKAHEIGRDERVAITLQDGSKFVSVSGTAELLRDRATIDRLWTDTWKVWFPEGKTDPAICVVKVNADRAEYWDLTSPNRVKYLFEAARAFVTGTTPKKIDGLHGDVKLSH